MEGKSELARCLQEIDRQYEAAQRGLTGVAITALHAYINARMERIALFAQQRSEQIGDLAAGKEACEAMEALHNEITAVKAKNPSRASDLSGVLQNK
jgi:N-methylhydantoinase A/oxoprolinase/acetone carboxylase beta subunit